MKIGIIGATGKAGSLIAAEAAARGYEVTAIVRPGSISKLPKGKYAVIAKDIFDLSVEDVKDFDVIVDAFGTPFGGPAAKGQEEKHFTSMQALIKVFEQLPNVRLLVVGGAGSLYANPEKTKKVVDSIPPSFQAVPLSMAKGFEALKNSKVNWTYQSPAGNFDSNGTRTGEYTLGTDFLITNTAGESYISYADYAVAMVDEMENKAFVGKRFTAVSEKAQTAQIIAAKKRDPSDIQVRLSQYRGPLCFELGGKSFELVMDNGYDYMVSFLTGGMLQWAKEGESFTLNSYECLKADETTYFINAELAGASPRTGITMVLDFENRLVTVLKAHQGNHPKYVYIVTNEVFFGAIKIDGEELPSKRHGYTADLVGKRIQWQYGSVLTLTHVYCSERFIRVGPMRMRDENPEMSENWRKYPYDEECLYIRIKEGLYFISFIEKNCVRHDPKMVGNNLAILMDTNRMHDVGRSFGLDFERKPENYLFAAIGKNMESDGNIEKEPSVYRI